MDLIEKAFDGIDFLKKYFRNPISLWMFIILVFVWFPILIFFSFGSNWFTNVSIKDLIFNFLNSHPLISKFCPPLVVIVLGLFRKIKNRAILEKTKFNILVAEFQDDYKLKGEKESSVKDVLKWELKDLRGVRVNFLDESISISGPNNEKNISKAHEKALGFLEKKGGDILIWGKVFKLNGTRISLSFTVFDQKSNIKKFNEYSIREADLGKVFLKDVGDVIRLIVISNVNEVLKMSDFYVPEKAKKLLNKLNAAIPELASAKRRDLFFWKAQLLLFLGEQAGDKKALAQSIKIYEKALSAKGGGRLSVNWAQVQFGFGNALRLLGERERENYKLKAALTIYKKVANEWRREKAPLKWGMVKNNSGIVLMRLGERENDVKKLKSAVLEYREALEVRTRTVMPLDWAMTQHNLGIVLTDLGVREKGTKKLEDASHAYGEALKERTRKFPRKWAMTLNNLGNVLTLIGERRSNKELLKRAVWILKKALRVRRKTSTLSDWAMTKNNVGDALRIWGVLETGTSKLRDAEFVFKEVLKERPREDDPLEWAKTQYNLGMTLMVLGERQGNAEKLKEAVDAFREALKERTKRRLPREYAATKREMEKTLKIISR